MNARILPLAACLVWTGPVFGQASVLLDAMSQELNRNYKALQEKADPPPYYLSYEVTEDEFASVSSSLGAVTNTNGARSRVLDVSVRVGSPALDNYHQVRGDRAQFTAGSALTYEDTPAAIKRRLWLDTDRAYRLAAERLIKIRTSTQVKVAQEDQSADFSKEEPQVSSSPAVRLSFNRTEWSDRVRKLSARFRKYPYVLTAQVFVTAQAETRYLVNTEGSRLQHGRGFARVIISAQAKADDGTDLSTSKSWEAIEPSGLPKDSEIESGIEQVAKDLGALLKAPAVDPFVGPAILSGPAAGVFFHEIFGHRIEGHRQKDEMEGQTFTKSVGQSVLPDFLSVVFDPTQRKINGVDLNGWYAYDDEGVKARPLTAVDRGILKNFLMSRSPVKGFDHSNGHGRRQPGYEVVSRQSNLIVQSTNAMPEARLRQMLIAEIKRQNKPYGLYFRDVTGGFTPTSRFSPQAFKVLPVIVYRVYADGRPDELVRGADIVGTPLASFSKILATSDQLAVFNGYCGAESGQVPVSAVAPAILVSEIEVEKKAKSQDRPPLLPTPDAAAEVRP